MHTYKYTFETRAQNTAAMLTTYNEIDMSAIMEMRDLYKDEFAKKHGIKLGFMSMFVSAACRALEEQVHIHVFPVIKNCRTILVFFVAHVAGAHPFMSFL